MQLTKLFNTSTYSIVLAEIGGGATAGIVLSKIIELWRDLGQPEQGFYMEISYNRLKAATGLNQDEVDHGFSLLESAGFVFELVPLDQIFLFKFNFDAVLVALQGV